MKKELLETILYGTINETIKWEEHKSMFTDEKNFYYRAKISPDTHIDVSLKLKESGTSLVYSDIPIIIVYNEKFEHKSIILTADSKEDELKFNKIGQFIFNNHIGVTSISNNTDSIIKSIISSILTKKGKRNKYSQACN